MVVSERQPMQCVVSRLDNAQTKHFPNTGVCPVLEQQIQQMRSLPLLSIFPPALKARMNHTLVQPTCIAS